MVLYSNNSISFKISNSDNSSIDLNILPENLQNSLNKGYVSEETDNLVISRLFYLFRNLGGFSNLDLSNDEIEVSNKNRIKNLYRKIKNRKHIVKYNLENDNIVVIWELLKKVIKNKNILKNILLNNTISLTVNDKEINVFIFTFKSLILPLVNKYNLEYVINYFESLFFDFNTDDLFIKENKISFQSYDDKKEYIRKIKENRRNILKHIIQTFQNEYQLVEIPDNLDDKQSKGIIKWIYSLFIRNN